MANAVEKVNTIAIADIEKINTRTDDNIEDLNTLEYSSGTTWRVHVYTSTSTFVVGASGGGNLEVMMIGGGGGGGEGGMGGGGGGGAAIDRYGNGYVASPTLPLTNDLSKGFATHTVTNGYTYEIVIAAGQTRDQASYDGTGGLTKISSDDSGSEVYLASYTNHPGGGGPAGRSAGGVGGQY